MNYADIMAAALRQPQPQTRGMQASVMSKPSQPDPVINEDLPLESVSPEDWIPNPKSVAAMLAKGGAGMGLAGITANDAYKVATEYAKSLKGKPAQALGQYTNTNSPLHAFRINTKMRNDVLTPSQQEYINTLTEVLRKAPKTDTPVDVYRGAPLFPQREKGFLSTTIDEEVADAYANFDPSDPGYVRKILLPKGSPMVNPDVKSLWDDQELLLPPGSMYSGNNGLILPEGFR